MTRHHGYGSEQSQQQQAQHFRDLRVQERERNRRREEDERHARKNNDAGKDFTPKAISKEELADLGVMFAGVWKLAVVIAVAGGVWFVWTAAAGQLNPTSAFATKALEMSGYIVGLLGLALGYRLRNHGRKLLFYCGGLALAGLTVLFFIGMILTEFG